MTMLSSRYPLLHRYTHNHIRIHGIFHYYLSYLHYAFEALCYLWTLE